MHKNYHHGNLRIALIEAGIALINKEGTKGLSLRKVAAMCGVSHSAPYAHFSNKESLFEAMQKYTAEQFVELFSDIIQNNDAGSPDIIDKLGIAYISFFIDNPEYFSFLFGNSHIKIDLNMEGDKKDSFPAFQIFKDTAAAVYEKLGMSTEQVQNIIIIKWSVVHGLAAIATMPGVVYDKDWKSQIKALLCLENQN